ncbi:hypothetical protein GQ600_25410 [Phytophthora cactorum]|nr:hypothetical protein GQ600_25410 [Phytophthora cactorum]
MQELFPRATKPHHELSLVKNYLGFQEILPTLFSFTRSLAIQKTMVAAAKSNEAQRGTVRRDKGGKEKKVAAPTIVRGTTRTARRPQFSGILTCRRRKSSLRVVLDWMTNPSNYNGKTKEALLNQIVQQLLSVGIEHRDRAGVLEKINTLEKQFRVQKFPSRHWSRNYRRKRSLIYCSKTLFPRDNFDTADTDPTSEAGSILQRGAIRPLAADNAQNDAKNIYIDSVEKLLNQQSEVLRSREEHRDLEMAFREREHSLKKNECQLKEEYPRKSTSGSGLVVEEKCN